MSTRFERFSERARRALTLAQEEAQRFNHNYIGTEHLLLGILDEGEGVAAKVLGTLAGDLAALRAAVEARITPGEEPVQQEIGLTPISRRAIELAVDEARRLNQIGTEHLLLGLARLERGMAVEVLRDLGLTLDRIRAETARILPAQATIRSAAAPLSPGHATLSRDPVDIAHVPRELVPLYTLVLRAARGEGRCAVRRQGRRT
jgi:ATP-dependent Clp protease ATP-binding subunit ClpC